VDQRSDTYQKGTRQFDEQRWGVLSTFSHLWQAVRHDIWRRTEVIKTIPKKATAVAETSTLKQQGCNLMKFYSSLHSRYSSCILLEFLDAWLSSAAILQALWLHSYSIRGTFQLALFGQQSNCNRMTFEVHTEHYDSILNIPTVLELHSSCIRELIHSECARIIRPGFAANS